MQPEAAGCFGTAGFGNWECQSRPTDTTIHARYSNELRPAPEAFARLSFRLLSGPHSAHHQPQGALVPRPYRHYRTLSEPCRPPLAEYLYQSDWSQLKLCRGSCPPPGPKPCCFGETFQETPATYLLEPRWTFLPPFPGPCPSNGYTTPCLKRRLGTGDLQWANIGRWNSAPTPFPPMQAVLAGLSMGPKEYFGELLQRRRRRRIWLTTGHDK
jgi:hypothetical protein